MRIKHTKTYKYCLATLIAEGACPLWSGLALVLIIANIVRSGVSIIDYLACVLFILAVVINSACFYVALKRFRKVKILEQNPDWWYAEKRVEALDKQLKKVDNPKERLYLIEELLKRSADTNRIETEMEKLWQI